MNYEKHKEWANSLQIGDIVCNCLYDHVKIVKFGKDKDLLYFDDGTCCSAVNCCESTDHEISEHEQE